MRKTQGMPAGLLITLLAGATAMAQMPPKPDLGPRTEPAIGTAVAVGGSGVCAGEEFAWFHPLGISRRGAFAYFLHTDEGPIHVWRFIITDLVHDKRLFAVSAEDPDNDMELKNFAFVNKDRISAALKKHGIDHRVPGELASLSSIRKGMRGWFTSGQDKKKKSHTRHEFFLQVPQQGQKRVTSILVPGDKSGCKVLGAYQSPYEPRLAILILHGAQGFEGRVTCQITVTGAHLESGY